ncbi:MAG TPA: hypothetical protein VG944_17855 [Fimbriimonas sp.]|nr:hypothetical protein [Fimbriimonas sp.]
MTIKRTLCGAPIALLATMAHAQMVNKPIWVSAGWNNLLNSDARDATSASGFQVGVGYHFGYQKSSGYSYDPSLDLTWARNTGNSNRLDTFALLAMARAPFSAQPPSAKNAFVPYYGLGIGIARNSFVGSGPAGGSSGGGGSQALLVKPHTLGGTGTGSASDYTLAARALIGVSFADMYFAELAYNYNGILEGSRIDSVTLTVGVRF